MGTQLLLGGRIYSSSSPDATAMAVTDGQVVWVGADEPARALHPDAEIVALDGAFVAPAFVDAHVHTTALGLKLTGLDLSGARSGAQCLELLRRYVAAEPTGVVWGHGWDDSGWPDSPPSVSEIDAAAPGRLVYLARIDAHSALCSSALRAVAGLAPIAGSDPLRADAHHEVRRAALAALDSAQRERARRAALDEAARRGIVAIHECAGPVISGADDLRELLAFEHGVQVRANWGERAESADEVRALLDRTGAHALAGDLFVDGSIGSHTAWLHQPYADDAAHGCGNSYLDADAMTAHIRACTQARVQAGFHVIGDAAMSAAVQAFGRVVAEVGGPAIASCGHRLEHAEMITTEQAAKLGAWGVIASVQPGFDAAWGGPDGMYAARLGAERAAQLNPFAAMASAGVSLAFGSDAPVTELRPWAAVSAAANHRTPGSGISARAAFAAATRGAWRAGGVRDGVAGTLVPGAPASYAIWDVDELVIAAPADSVQRWSTDPRSRVPALPRLATGEPEPRCLRTVHLGETIHAA
ncbi:amidohydrolase family protein [Aldersonia sp. NBC_00410]|uniref:amidohydrolase n=1 Tax=Aldersonia sp. NBC_00410 TaxID=2975954 RepID=UPI0022508C2F|nr:amidohydrolase family protein [Aldersonia sp. NBC_00410]MCX5045796.1 amidohydrolase family protein [Aldersonia sp. NBC_00410]